jgi:transcription elongation factor SPT5
MSDADEERYELTPFARPGEDEDREEREEEEEDGGEEDEEEDDEEDDEGVSRGTKRQKVSSLIYMS